MTAASVAALLVALVGDAAAPAGDADACALVVDHDADDVAVVVRREEHVVAVETHDPALADPPVVVAIEGVAPLARRVIRAAPGGDGAQRVATIEIAPTLAAACAPGRYDVGRGDRIGADIVVVAVLREGLLVEHKGGLGFAPFPGRAPPPFRMIWSSTYRLLRPAAAPPPAPPAPRRAPPKKKKR